MVALRRVIAISDLHIGGDAHPMLGHPEHLIDFLAQLASYRPAEGEQVELVIHGDFVDFLAEEPSAPWTADEDSAVTKLRNIFGRQRKIFDALAACIAAVRRFTVLLGNHDVELAYPRVREALFQRLGTEPHRCLFIGNNESYRVGDLLIEHGNRYDTWNAIDHDGLRETVSAASRGEEPPRSIGVCPGSRLVHEVINPLKERYHFIDLLKPEDKLVLLLLTTFEPELMRDLSLLFNSAAAYISRFYRKAIWKIASRGPAPGQARLVSREGGDELPLDVRRAFTKELSLATAEQAVSVGGHLRKLFLRDQTRSLKTRLVNGEPIESERLRKLQVALRAKLAGDTSFNESEVSSEYARAARHMIETETAKVVVMGHTHLRRDVEFAGGRYLNTGTWADLLRVEDAILVDSEEGREALVGWLRQLATDQIDGIRLADPTYADVRVNNDGHVVADGKPMLRRHGTDMRFA